MPVAAPPIDSAEQFLSAKSEPSELVRALGRCIATDPVAIDDGEITLKDGRVEQTNFDTYPMLRMNEAPAIEVHIVQSFEPPGGMGEHGTSAIAPAVTNAIFAVTGKRLRKLPIDTAALKQPV